MDVDGINMIRQRMGVKTISSHSKYLGLPSIFGKSKKVFSQVIDKGSSQNEKKIHWASWDKLAYAKCVGGLGFRGVGDFNVSLLGKYVWRPLTGGPLLMQHIFQSKYYSRGTIKEAQLGYSLSYARRNMFGARELVLGGSRWRARNGKNQSIT
ncbi:hypothetical protein KIW84_043853 [Lathyrus oleraceus]|uniref:Uncharacterized protein n=1 Tax=Pisum sativum TaxID=3888 RepID=A0A9D4XGV0_PEA|nr:hypothetical protein KIW84_043853 [Pisum sativum]